MMFHLVIVCLLASYTHGLQVCPRGYTLEVMGKCLLIDEAPDNYDKKEGICSSKNGVLVKVENEAKLAAIDDVLSGTYEYWIGAKYETTISKWVWRDEEHLTYFPWISGTPNVAANEKCVSMANPGSTPGWNYNICSDFKKALCESEKTTATCPAGWTIIGTTAPVCVRMIRKYRRSFSDARTYCKNKGGDLADRLVTQEYMTKVLDGIKFRGHSWLGVVNNAGSIETIWGDVVNAPPFKPGRPNPDNSKKCLAMKGTYWYDKDCTRRMFFVCQTDAVY